MAMEYPPTPSVRSLPRYSQDQLTCTQDELGRKRYVTPEGRRVCGRLKARDNRQIPDEACMGPPMPAGPCRVHGGASPGAPLTAGGRYSKFLKHWKNWYEEALEDKALLDVRPDIAMMDTAIGRLVGRAEELDCPSWRQDLRATFKELSDAIRAGRQRAVGPALKKLGDLIEKGADSDRVTAELTAAVDRRAERATKIIALKIRAGERITRRQVMIFFANWLEMLRTELDGATFMRLMPHFRELGEICDFVVPGSLQEVAREEAAEETQVEFETFADTP